MAGLYPSCWPLPLTRQGLAEAARNPVLQTVPTGPVTVKRQPNSHGSDGGHTIKAEKVHMTMNTQCPPIDTTKTADFVT